MFLILKEGNHKNTKIPTEIDLFGDSKVFCGIFVRKWK